MLLKREKNTHWISIITFTSLWDTGKSEYINICDAETNIKETKTVTTHKPSVHLSLAVQESLVFQVALVVPLVQAAQVLGLVLGDQVAQVVQDLLILLSSLAWPVNITNF